MHTFYIIKKAGKYFREGNDSSIKQFWEEKMNSQNSDSKQQAFFSKNDIYIIETTYNPSFCCWYQDNNSRHREDYIY